jgi:hypothetical protein
MFYNIREGEEVFCKFDGQMIIASIDWINIGKAQVDIVPFGNYRFGIHTISLDTVILSDKLAREWYYKHYLPRIGLFTRKGYLCSIKS